MATLQSYFECATDRVAQLNGVAITYRGDDGVVLTGVTAVRGSTRAEQETSRGMTLATQIEDFLIDADQLTHENERIEPDSGHLIDQVIDGVTHRYRVSPPAPNQPAWRFRDAGRKRLRIHTQYLGEAS